MRGEDRREMVLECAAELFAQNGYHRTTVSHIVDRAAIARGTFYLYFKDKRSIFDELLNRFIQRIDARIIRIDPALGLDQCMRLLRENIEVVLKISLVEQRNLAKILISDAVGLDEEFDLKLLGFYSLAATLIESALTLGQEMGVVRRLDERIMAVFLLGALKEVLYQALMRGLEADPDRLVDELLDLCVQGIMTLPEG